MNEWPLPLRGKWLKALLIVGVVGAPLAKSTGSLLDVGKYWLVCALAVGVAKLVQVAAERCCATHENLARAHTGALLLTAGLVVAAFLAWINPTEWREWQEGSETYREHRLTGRVQVLMECGCGWDAADGGMLLKAEATPH